MIVVGSSGASEVSPALSGGGIQRRRRVLSKYTKEKDEEERILEAWDGIIEGMKTIREIIAERYGSK